MDPEFEVVVSETGWRVFSDGGDLVAEYNEYSSDCGAQDVARLMRFLGASVKVKYEE